MNVGNSALDGRYKNDQMRALSLTVYSQCRRLLIHQNGVKSLTGFGPAAAAELFLKGKDVSDPSLFTCHPPPCRCMKLNDWFCYREKRKIPTNSIRLPSSWLPSRRKCRKEWIGWEGCKVSVEW